LNETKPLFEKINKVLQGTENPAWKKCYDIFKQVDRVFFQDREAFFKEYIELLPSLNEDSIVRESVVFCHNDTQENNFMHAFSHDANGVKEIHEVKIIDFEYSGINHRGVDLAGYIIEACINYDVDTIPKYEIDESKFPAFDGPAKEGTLDLDFLITTYLTNFYENHLPGLIEDYKHIEKFKSLDAYLAHELPVLKS
jgi:thiamine kinase-like enzyme